MFAWLMLALGSTPTSQVLSDGTVSSSIFIQAAPEQIRARLDSPRTLARLTAQGDLESQVSASQDGEGRACWLLTRERTGAMYKVAYRSRACLTEDGMVETLVDSEELIEQSTRWQVLPHGTGSLVVLQVRTTTRLPVPSSLVRNASIREGQACLVRLQRAFETARE
ncbi:MAG: hypothetical protein ACI9VR_001577 [Cognaticolwellia sp.]|jgi:hypothetical protein